MLQPALDTAESYPKPADSPGASLIDSITRELYTGLVILDDNLRTIYANPTAEMLFGREHGALLGRQSDDFLENSSYDLQLLNSGQTQRLFLNLAPEANRIIPTAVTYSRTQLENHAIYIISLVTLDQAEDWSERLMHNDRLASIGTLLTSVAHELTNPISVILTTCSNLEDVIKADSSASEILNRYVDMIQQNALRCVRLIETLRIYSHNGTLRDATPINLIIEHGVNLISAQFEKRENFPILLDLAADLPPVTCDPNQIIQVLINLMTNARDAMLPDGGQIRVQSWFVPELQSVAFSVQDGGSGIPQDQISQIFDPFYTTKGRGKGTGLGLFIAGEIVKQHSGWIRAQNLHDEEMRVTGARFTVILPTT